MSDPFFSRLSQFSVYFTQSKWNLWSFKNSTWRITRLFLTINTWLHTTFWYVRSCYTINFFLALWSIRSCFTVYDFALSIIRISTTINLTRIWNKNHTRSPIIYNRCSIISRLWNEQRCQRFAICCVVSNTGLPVKLGKLWTCRVKCVKLGSETRNVVTPLWSCFWFYDNIILLGVWLSEVSVRVSYHWAITHVF